MKTIIFSFICLFYMLNATAAKHENEIGEIEEKGGFVLIKVIKNEISTLNNLNLSLDSDERYKKVLIEDFSIIRSQNVLKTYESRHFLTTSAFSTTAIISNFQDREVGMNSAENKSLSHDSSLGKKTSTALVSNVIHTHSEKIGAMKFKAKLKSISLTVFF